MFMAKGDDVLGKKERLEEYPELNGSNAITEGKDFRCAVQKKDMSYSECEACYKAKKDSTDYCEHMIHNLIPYEKERIKIAKGE